MESFSATDCNHEEHVRRHAASQTAVLEIPSECFDRMAAAIRRMGAAAGQFGFHTSSEIKTRLAHFRSPEFDAWRTRHGIQQVAADPDEAAEEEEETREQGQASADVSDAMLSAALQSADADDIQQAMLAIEDTPTHASETRQLLAEEVMANNLKIGAALAQALAAPAEAFSIPARVEPDAWAAPAEASSMYTRTESAPEEVQLQLALLDPADDPRAAHAQDLKRKAAAGTAPPPHKRVPRASPWNKMPPPGNVWEHVQKQGLHWLSAVFPSFGETMQLPEEVLAAIRQGSRQAFEQDAVPMATLFPEFSAWAENLDMNRALTDPVEERYQKN